jgi:hypothetical protein
MIRARALRKQRHPNPGRALFCLSMKDWLKSLLRAGHTVWVTALYYRNRHLCFSYISDALAGLCCFGARPLSLWRNGDPHIRDGSLMRTFDTNISTMAAADPTCGTAEPICDEFKPKDLVDHSRVSIQRTP